MVTPSDPSPFRFGVATAGFQVEGGYNRPGQPANNWAAWEQSGRAEPSGTALRFWDDYEQQLDRVASLGCNAFRMSVEWTRCEPSPGEVDDGAFARYAAILEACQDRGLEPVVTLHHFTHPEWLGADLWLSPRAPERFAEWVATAVDRLGPHCPTWVTVNEINVLALQTYFTGMFPPGRRFDVSATIRSMDHLLTAHVLAYGEIKRRQPDAVVSTNSYPMSIYEIDRLLLDVLLSRRQGLARHEVGEWLRARRSRHHATTRPSMVERGLRRLAASGIPLEMALPRSLGAVFAAPSDCTLDVIQIDHYDPVVSNHLRLPGHRTAGGRAWLPARMLWDDPVDPRSLIDSCRTNAEPGLPLWVLENGLCNRVLAGPAFPRLDGWTRERYLTEHFSALREAWSEGVPVAGYFHWTLADNYEWGSYEPRFGLFGIERLASGDVRWSDRDSMGGDAAGTYRRLIAQLRAEVIQP